MRSATLAVLSLSAVLLLAPAARAQNYQAPNSLGGAANALNGFLNPQNNNQQNGGQPQNYGQSNQGYRPDDRRVNDRGGPYAGYNDDQLRQEARRIHDQDRMIDDEMRRRNLR